MTINATNAIKGLRATAATALKGLSWFVEWQGSDTPTAISGDVTAVPKDDGYIEVSLPISSSTDGIINKVYANYTEQDSTTIKWLTIQDFTWSVQANTAYKAIIKLSFRNDLGGVV